MALLRSEIDRWQDPGFFLWATGIEDTFITAPCEKTGRTLDEYELTDHYARWRADLDLMASLGVRAARYGIPWHRIQPESHRWDWSFADGTLHRLLELGIDPIVDLVHYGLPSWIEYAYLNPDYPKFVAEYAARVAERYKGKIFHYTPLNEPRVTAWYCGKLGWWPPFKKGWRGFLQVMLGVCRGIVTTVRALESIDPEITPIHVDATDLYFTEDPSLQMEVERRQEVVFLALDLISGRIVPGHALFDWMVALGVAPGELDWFKENAIDLPVIGINLYPLFSRKVLKRGKSGVRIKMPYADASIVSDLAEKYYHRYRCPIFISETASCGSVKKRREWLLSSVKAVRQVRERGVPLVGYTWWPMFALITWACRQGTHPPSYYLKQMGLWNLKSDPEKGLERIDTPLVELYRDLVRNDVAAVGELRTEPSTELAHVS